MKTMKKIRDLVLNFGLGNLYIGRGRTLVKTMLRPTDQVGYRLMPILNPQTGTFFTPPAQTKNQHSRSNVLGKPSRVVH